LVGEVQPPLLLLEGYRPSEHSGASSEVLLQQYHEEAWSDWEAPLLDIGSQEGLSGTMVDSLRGEALNLAEIVSDSGKPISD
jgi:hypothetical protein